MSKVLARAFPYKGYRWYNSLRDIFIEARLTNRTISYYEVQGIRNKRLTEEVVQSLFPVGRGVPGKERPFHHKENKEFYIILRRRRKKYKEAFQELLRANSAQMKSTLKRTSVKRTKMKRTKNSFKRTK